MERGKENSDLRRTKKALGNARRLAAKHTNASISKAELLAAELRDSRMVVQKIMELTLASSRLDKALKNHKEIEESELRLTVEHVRKLEWNWAFEDGLEEGYRIAQQRYRTLPKLEKKLKRAQGQWRALKVMVKILEDNPQTSAVELFKQMDKRKVPVFAYGRNYPGQNFRKWSDVAQEQGFKNLVSKARRDVRLGQRARTWEKLAGL
jgi:hypothetical protein